MKIMKLLRKGPMTFLYISNARLVFSFQFRSNDQRVTIAQQNSFWGFFWGVFGFFLLLVQITKYATIENGAT
jgi:hypothetical protein